MHDESELHGDCFQRGLGQKPTVKKDAREACEREVNQEPVNRMRFNIPHLASDTSLDIVDETHPTDQNQSDSTDRVRQPGG